MNPEFDAALKQGDEPQLRAMLEQIQLRLGTSAEQPGDIERACAVGHELNNLLTHLRISAELRRLKAIDHPSV